MNSIMTAEQPPDQPSSATAHSESPSAREEVTQPTCSQGRQCTEITREGDRCHAQALAGSSMCFFHDPASAQKRAEAAKRGGEKNRATVLPSATPDFALNSAADASALVARTINQVLRGEIDPKIANAVGYLLTVHLKAYDADRLERRIAAIEAVVMPEKEDR
jgi:hypothetical protein